ncbi:MAG TPA: hypothetical protein VLE27_15235, partial [Thermoanaerobaculia bacterium]|nr:hypothetical protein [Thermoanaerobaculia bacterium]
MKGPLRDPDLDRLVRQLNEQGGAASEPDADLFSPVFESAVFESPSSTESATILRQPSQVLVNEGEGLDRLLVAMAQGGASDLLLVAGMPPIFRVNGRLNRVEDVGPLEAEEIGKLFQ